MRSVGLLVVLGLAQGGCFGLLKGVRSTQSVKIQAKALGTAGPSVLPGQVQVSTTAALPPGFFYAVLPGNQVKLWAVPAWPTSTDPHRVISAIGWTGGASGVLPSEVIAAAAKVGANTLVKLQGRNIAYAAYISSAVATDPAPAAADLLAQHAAAYPDLTANGAVITVPANEFAPLPVAMQKNHCYRVAVALDEAAHWSDAARAFLTAKSRSSDALAGNRSSGLAEPFTTNDGVTFKAPYQGKLVRLRSFSVGLGCASGDGQATLVLTGKGNTTALGTGNLHVQVLSKAITADETALLLAKRKAAFEKAAAESAAFAARAQARRAQAAQAQVRRDAQAARRAKSRRGSTRRTSSGPTRISVTISSRCKKTVRTFQGRKPKFGSGTYGRHSANSSSSYSGNAGDMIWIVDERQNGLGAYTLTAGVRNLVILPSCTGFAPR